MAHGFVLATYSLKLFNRIYCLLIICHQLQRAMGG